MNVMRNQCLFRQTYGLIINEWKASERIGINVQTHKWNKTYLSISK